MIIRFIVVLFINVTLFSCAKRGVLETALDNAKINDTIIINKEINLEGKTIYLKKEDKLVFKGGEIQNGTIYCDKCKISAGAEKIAENVVFKGDWSGNTGYVEWFTADDLTNPVKNFTILENLIVAGFTIGLVTMVPVSIPSEEYLTTSSIRSIVMKGTDKDNSGLMLVTKNRNLFYNYFRAESGINLILKDLTILTKDYKDGMYSEKEAEYFLTGSYYQEQFNPRAKPNIDSIILRNCTFKGNIGIACYGSGSHNQSFTEYAEGNRIKRLVIENSFFEGCNSPFSFSNMCYDSILIRNNEILNFSSAFLSIPESGLKDEYYEPLRKRKGIIIFEANRFENNRVVSTPDERTLSPCVVKGGYGTMYFSGNTLRNLLSDNPNADVNTFYYTCEHPGKFIVRNNMIKNVCGRGSVSHPSCLVKQRWASYFELVNNDISIDKEALTKIGILRNNEKLQSLDGNKFYFDFIQIGGQSSFRKRLLISHNKFYAPYINKSTEIYDVAEFSFLNNTINIEVFGPSGVNNSVSMDHVFFLGRQRLDRPAELQPLDFVSKGNKIKIGYLKDRLFYYVHYPDGVQSGTIDKEDANYNYKIVSAKDTFYVNDADIGITLPDGAEQDYKIAIRGKNNGFFFTDYANANHTRANAQKFSSELYFDSDEWGHCEKAPFVFMPDSKQIIRSANHKGDVINLFSYSYLNSLYNLRMEEDLLCQVSAVGNTVSGSKFNKEFYFVVNNISKTFLFEDAGGTFMEKDPSVQNNVPNYVRSFSSERGNAYEALQLKIISGDRHLRETKIILAGCSEISDYNIQCNIRRAGRENKDLSKIMSKIADLKKRQLLE